MKRIILIYGLIAGLIVAAGMVAAMAIGLHSMVFGYLTMLVALSMVFMGIKQYRDEHLGGTIRFGTAIATGLGISLVATVLYVLGWEAYLFTTDYTFMPEYVAQTIEAERARGASAADLARMQKEFDGYITMYESPPLRMGMTALEIAPVALLVTLVSAALLRNPGFLPARTGRYETGVN